MKTLIYIAAFVISAIYLGLPMAILTAMISLWFIANDEDKAATAARLRR